ncbi:MAG: hypothetical protein ABW039_13905 [Sphingobium sp.]
MFSPALAQTADTNGLEDIVVTARKVSENLQDVPVAITAFTAEALQRQGARRKYPTSPARHPA